MGVKYRVDYKDNHDNDCRIDISTDSYSGTPILLRGVKNAACILERDCGDDPSETIISTKASITVYQEEHYPIDILELQEAQDREFTVVQYLNDNINFSGFLVPDGIQQTFQAAPFELNINATDGLMLLNGLNYSVVNLEGGRCILNYLRGILFSNGNLGLPLPIRWVNELKNDQFPLEEDVFSGSVRWSERGEGFTDYNGNYKTCMYILEGMLKSMQCRIFQDAGKWVIWRINDIVDGESVVRETPGTLVGFEINTLGLVDHNKTIGGDETFNYRFIQEDAILTVLPGLKSVSTTYNQDQRNNILPNGNMDIVITTTGGTPLYWGLNPGSTGSAMSINSLSDAFGSAVRVSNPAPASEATFQLYDLWLPVDFDVLYPSINFGFKFSIINGYLPDVDGFIDWSGTPFSLMVRYDNGSGNLLYLNEFGFWTTNPVTIDPEIAGLRPGDVAQIDFNSKQDIIMPLPVPVPIERTSHPKIWVGFFIPSGRVADYDDIYITVESNSDVYTSTIETTNTDTESYDLNISSSHNGFYVSNFMSNYSEAGLEKFYSDSKITGVTLTEMNSHAILRNRYKSSLVFEGSIYSGQYSYAEIYTIQTLNGKKFLPLRSVCNTETNVVNLTAVEVRDDGTGIIIRHYGSNDKTVLSN